ncbi:MAG: alpha-1,4-glucan--maltose-1-phosphate maltosyltransferase [Propionibacteriaceae bacterium]|jgi:starch synthase (maltosyl-transferring)|nr:alpha-1,4-glucan--maltose-1-phosphate maltosyltransferase [Propionibacteriaceae bacterium]
MPKLARPSDGPIASPQPSDPNLPSTKDSSAKATASRAAAAKETVGKSAAKPTTSRSAGAKPATGKATAKISRVTPTTEAKTAKPVKRTTLKALAEANSTAIAPTRRSATSSRRSPKTTTNIRAEVAPRDPGLARGIGRIPVVKVEPVIEGGAYPAKAVVAEEFPITARIFREGHDQLGASVVLTSPNGQTRSLPLTQIEPIGLDIYQTRVSLDQVGAWTFRIEAWSAPFNSWLHNATIKLTAGIDRALVLAEGRQLLEQAISQSLKDDPVLAATLTGYRPLLAEHDDVADTIAALTDPSFAAAINRNPLRELITPTADFPVWVDRVEALYGSWYEMFPRSQGAFQAEDGHWVSGTFDSAAARLPEIAAMGFSVVYLPPIHPIGRQFRKGPNNSLVANPGDPGSPWAVGGPEGGHDAIHPDLGDFDSFGRFVDQARSLGLEVALDFALQVSPDHPWVSQHPNWFSHRVDGSIAYAENPPKKYQDIYPLNFDNDPDGLYLECLRLLEFWVARGVTIFRVDNPHTKPVQFWAWLMAKMRQLHPEVIFLAEAFTAPEMMQALGEVGFQQSYTYFTWRTSKWELEEYLGELAGPLAASFRPNFFVNTPDINPTYLQDGNEAAFAIRAILAATLSPSWGVYSGFELFEHLALPGREEYADSEKYQYRPRDYQAQPNLNQLISILNQTRQEHLALQRLRNIHFHETSNDAVIAYSKQAGGDTVIIVVSLDPVIGQQANVHLDLEALGLADQSSFTVHDHLTGNSWQWGRDNFVNLYPAQPAHLLVVQTNA